MRPGTLRLASLPPLSLYVHLPWCLKKCPYYDFNSHGQAQGAAWARYSAALLADLDAALPLVLGRRCTASFWRGTPSLFAPGTIDALVGAIRPPAAGAGLRLRWRPILALSKRTLSPLPRLVTRLSVGDAELQRRAVAGPGACARPCPALAAVEEAARSFAPSIWT